MRGIDQDQSLVVVAPTSSGKTYIAQYAVLKVLETGSRRNRNNDIAVFVQPTNALVHQTYSDMKRLLQGRRGYKETDIAVFEKDYRRNLNENFRVLITNPECFLIRLLSKTASTSSATNFIDRLKYVIFDEVHNVSAKATDMVGKNSIALEQLIALVPCPILGLTGSIYNSSALVNWFKKLKGENNVKFIYRNERSTGQKFYSYLPEAHDWNEEDFGKKISTTRLQTLEEKKIEKFSTSIRSSNELEDDGSLNAFMLQGIWKPQMEGDCIKITTRAKPNAKSWASMEYFLRFEKKDGTHTNDENDPWDDGADSYIDFGKIIIEIYYTSNDDKDEHNIKSGACIKRSSLDLRYPKASDITERPEPEKEGQVIMKKDEIEDWKVAFRINEKSIQNQSQNENAETLLKFGEWCNMQILLVPDTAAVDSSTSDDDYYPKMNLERNWSEGTVSSNMSVATWEMENEGPDETINHHLDEHILFNQEEDWKNVKDEAINTLKLAYLEAETRALSKKNRMSLKLRSNFGHGVIIKRDEKYNYPNIINLNNVTLRQEDQFSGWYGEWDGKNIGVPFKNFNEQQNYNPFRKINPFSILDRLSTIYPSKHQRLKCLRRLPVTPPEDCNAIFKALKSGIISMFFFLDPQGEVPAPIDEDVIQTIKSQYNLVCEQHRQNNEDGYKLQWRELQNLIITSDKLNIYQKLSLDIKFTIAFSRANLDWYGGIHKGNNAYVRLSTFDELLAFDHTEDYQKHLISSLAFVVNSKNQVSQNVITYLHNAFVYLIALLDNEEHINNNIARSISKKTICDHQSIEKRWDNYFHRNVSSNTYTKDILVPLIKDLKSDKKTPSLIFHFNKKWIFKYIQILVKQKRMWCNESELNADNPFLSIEDEELLQEELFDTDSLNSDASILIEGLKVGIGAHFSSSEEEKLLPYIGIVEKMFKNKKLSACFATGSLAFGINMPTKSVVFLGDSFYLDKMMFLQCAGRAGRRGYEISGSIIFCSMPFALCEDFLHRELPALRPIIPVSIPYMLRVTNALYWRKNNGLLSSNLIRQLKNPFYRELDKAPSNFDVAMLNSCIFSIIWLSENSYLFDNGMPNVISNIINRLYYLPDVIYLSHLISTLSHQNNYLRELYDKCKRQNQIFKDHLLLFLIRVLNPTRIVKYEDNTSLKKQEEEKDFDKKLLFKHTEKFSKTNVQSILIKYCKSLGETFIEDTLVLDQNPFQFQITQAANNIDHIDINLQQFTDWLSRQKQLKEIKNVYCRSPFSALSGKGDTFDDENDIRTAMKSMICIDPTILPKKFPKHDIENYIWRLKSEKSYESIKIDQPNIYKLAYTFEKALKCISTAAIQIYPQRLEDEDDFDFAFDNDNRRETRPKPAESLIIKDLFQITEEFMSARNAANNKSTEIIPMKLPRTYWVRGEYVHKEIQGRIRGYVKWNQREAYKYLSNLKIVGKSNRLNNDNNNDNNDFNIEAKNEPYSISKSISNQIEVTAEDFEFYDTNINSNELQRQMKNMNEKKVEFEIYEVSKDKINTKVRNNERNSKGFTIQCLKINHTKVKENEWKGTIRIPIDP